MPQLSKKTLIIIGVIVFIIIIVIVVDIFLFIKFRQAQEDAALQTKINQDVQQVQQIIQSGQIEQLDVDDLKQQGVADEAVTIAEQAIKEEQERQKQIAEQKESDKIENKIVEIMNQYDIYSDTQVDIATNLLNISPTIINDLGQLTKVSDAGIRFDSYKALGIIGAKYSDKRSEIMPILAKANEDPIMTIKYGSMQTLLRWGNKESIPVMIDCLNPVNESILMPSEPPMPLPDYCALALFYYTDQQYNVDPIFWQKWWQENEQNISWDQQRSEFVTQ